MPTYLSPGVYVEEVESGARPLEGVGTAVAAFVGLAEDGPVQPADAGEQLDRVHRHVRRVRAGSYLAQSVYGYFMNGGGNCYVVRIGQDGCRDRAPRSARARELAGRAAGAARTAPSRRDPARRPAGELSVEIADAGGENPAEDMFKVVVKRNGETGRGVRPREPRPRQDQRRDRRQRDVQGHPDRGGQRRRRGDSRSRRDRAHRATAPRPSPTRS